MNEEQFRIETGKRLKAIRERKGISSREANRRLGVSNSYISQMENGKIPSLEMLNKICELYEVEISEVFGQKLVEPPPELLRKNEWIEFIREMEKEKLTPTELRKYIQIVNTLKSL